MKKLFFLLSIVALATLELNWPPALKFFYCQPDLLLIFSLALVFYQDFKTALFFAVLSGLIKDVFIPQTLALNAICFGVFSYALYRLRRQISTDEPYVRWGIVFLVTLLTNIILGLQILATGVIISPVIFLRNLIITSVYTMLLSPLVFKFTKKISA